MLGEPSRASRSPSYRKSRDITITPYSYPIDARFTDYYGKDSDDDVENSDDDSPLSRRLSKVHSLRPPKDDRYMLHISSASYKC